MASPRHPYLATVKRIIRYMKGTLQRGLCYPAETSPTLHAYSDADYARCSNTRRSITGGAYFLVLLSFHEKVRNKIGCLNHLMNLNTGLCHKPVQKYSNYEYNLLS